MRIFWDFRKNLPLFLFVSSYGAKYARKSPCGQSLLVVILHKTAEEQDMLISTENLPESEKRNTFVNHLIESNA